MGHAVDCWVMDWDRVRGVGSVFSEEGCLFREGKHLGARCGATGVGGGMGCVCGLDVSSMGKVTICRERECLALGVVLLLMLLPCPWGGIAVASGELGE